MLPSGTAFLLKQPTPTAPEGLDALMLLQTFAMEWGVNALVFRRPIIPSGRARFAAPASCLQWFFGSRMQRETQVFSNFSDSVLTGHGFEKKACRALENVFNFHR